MSSKTDPDPVRPGRARSIGRTISVWIAWQCLLGLSITCTAVYWVTAMSFGSSQNQLLVERRRQVEHVLAETPSRENYERLRHRLDELLLGARDIDLRLKDDSGETFYDRSLDLDQRSVRVVTFTVPDPFKTGSRLSAELTVDLTRDSTLLRAIATALAVAAVTGTIVVALGSLLLVRLGLRPLHTLVDELRKVDASSIDSRIDGRQQPAELKPLVFQFNALLTRLQTAYDQLEGFNADVAHELLTPLTTLIGSTEYALRRRRSHAELQEILGQNLEDLHRLNGIVQDMLFLSRADRGALARRTHLRSIASIVWKVIEFHRAALEEAELAVQVVGDSEGAVDQSLLGRALSNLLSNAIRHARRGSTVTVSIETDSNSKDGAGIQITVRNEGEPIAPTDLSRIFDRFYRIDTSRHSSTRNHGLGLAIVAAIARMHLGKPVVLPDTDGATIGLTLAAFSDQGSVKRTDTGG